MNCIIVMRGAQSEKVVDGQLQQVTPFLAVERKVEDACMGIGFMVLDEQKELVWGSSFPHTLIQSWQGMKVLERAPYIDGNTVKICWALVQHNDTPSYGEHELVTQFAGEKKLQNIREEVLMSIPLADELNAMIVRLRNSGASINVNLGGIAPVTQRLVSPLCA